MECRADRLSTPTKQELSSLSRAEAFLALMQLVELRDAWNKVDGFVVDWKDYIQLKYIIETTHDIISIDTDTEIKSVLAFGSAETRDKFLSTHKLLIEQAKELL